MQSQQLLLLVVGAAAPAPHAMQLRGPLLQEMQLHQTQRLMETAQQEVSPHLHRYSKTAHLALQQHLAPRKAKQHLSWLLGQRPLQVLAQQQLLLPLQPQRAAVVARLRLQQLAFQPSQPAAVLSG